MALDAGAKHLWEHGIFAPYLAMVPFADFAPTYQKLGRWVASDCFYESPHGLIRIQIQQGLPTGYLGLSRPFENGDPRNALYVEDMAPVPSLDLTMPLKPFVAQAFTPGYRIGIANRLNGYVCNFTPDGQYTEPVLPPA
jgi:hypothetical protein